jgi:hypothetical protein
MKYFAYPPVEDAAFGKAGKINFISFPASKVFCHIGVKNLNNDMLIPVSCQSQTERFK